MIQPYKNTNVEIYRKTAMSWSKKNGDVSDPPTIQDSTVGFIMY